METVSLGVTSTENVRVAKDGRYLHCRWGGKLLTRFRLTSILMLLIPTHAKTLNLVERVKDTLKISAVQVLPSKLEIASMAQPDSLIKDVVVAGVVR